MTQTTETDETRQKPQPVFLSDRYVVSRIEQESAKTGEPKSVVAARFITSYLAILDARQPAAA